MEKFYAVKKGRKKGIYRTWTECKKQVMGFSGAVYKSFPTRLEAEKFIADEQSEPQLSEGATAYCDGSFDKKTNRYSYGVVVFYQGEEVTFSEAFDDAEMASMRNVAGEIEGSMRAMRYCVEHNIPLLHLYFDYQGIESWCIGAWKTNKKGTILYREYYLSIQNQLKVVFHKVKGHSGDTYNDMVDMLAKKALGLER